jgi:purine nucleoside permease
MFAVLRKSWSSFLLLVLIVSICSITTPAVAAQISPQEKIKVKVFIGSMFEIGANTGDRAGEFQHWYERYWTDSQPVTISGAENPLFCNADGVAGSVLGMGKVRSSSSMQAILLDPRYDFSETYFIISGVAGTPPSRGTIAAVFWGTSLVDYDLGHRWAPEENAPGEPAFMPRKGYEQVRLLHLNPTLVDWAMKLTAETPLQDSDSAKAYRLRYPDETARHLPFVGKGTHLTGDCFFHGPGLSKEAQYITELYKVDPYVITEMEGTAVGHVIRKMVGLDRVMSLRTAVNFDQGNPNETTLQHLDPAPGQTPGGFEVGVENVMRVGSRMVNHIVNNWPLWSKGVPPITQ